MAFLGLSLVSGSLTCPAAPETPAEAVLANALRVQPTGTPVVILIHGFKYSSASARHHPGRRLYACGSVGTDSRHTGWPTGLGFRAGTKPDGLCIGYITSASRGYRTGMQLALGYVRYGSLAEGGSCDVRVFGQNRGAIRHDPHVYDPGNVRMKR